MIKRPIMAAAVLIADAAMALGVAGPATAGGAGAQQVSGSDAFGFVSGSLEAEMTDTPDSFASFLRTRVLTPSGELTWRAPVIFVIEIISHLSRVLSLTLRLFGNIFGEHLVVLIIASIIPFLMPLPIQFLGLVAGTLQAFIFLTLGSIYLSAAVAVDEHH